MSVAVLALPRMGETMESGRVVAWLKQPGDRFSRGETLVEIETDKTTVELPALSDGKLIEILAREGSDVEVGSPLCRFDATLADAVAAISDGAATGMSPAEVAPAFSEREKGENTVLRTLTLPRLGETMESGRIGAWLKQPGDRFSRGETVVEIESDKTTVELPALEDGELVEILAAEGSEIEVGAPLCRYHGAGTAAEAEASLATEPPPAFAEEPIAPVAAQLVRTASGRYRATPVARRLARQSGISLHGITGTGRRGRIEASDVRSMLSGAVQAPGSNSALAAAPRLATLAAGRLAWREWCQAGSHHGTVLMLHGFSGDAQTWSGLAALLADKGLRVIAPDLPAHGRTEIEAESVEALVPGLSQFVEHLDLRSLELVGHSMGALAAAQLAATLGNRIRRLTLIAPAGMSSAIDAEFIEGMARANAPGALAHLLRRVAVRPPALDERQLASMAQALGGTGRLRHLAASLVRDGLQQQDIVQTLGQITTPTRLIWGLEDRILPWMQVAAAPSRTAIHLIAGAGHMPHWDKPQEVAALFD